MGVTPATFDSGGKLSQHYLPGAYSQIDYVPNGNGVVAANNSVILGDARGGKPNTLVYVGSEAEAIAILRSGSLLDAIRHAFNPGGGFVPQRIGFMRVNPGTQSQRTLQSSAANIITLKSADYGVHTNQLKAKLEAGTTGKKFTVQFQNEAEIVVDDIIRPSITIQYIGAGAAATMDIDDTSLVTTVDAVEDLNIDFASFATIESLVAYINDQSDYTCVAATGDLSQKTIHLDAVSSQDIKTSAYTSNSNLQALIEAIETIPYIGEVSYVGASRVVPDNDADFVYFSGAIDGAYTATEWGVSLTALENENVQLVGASSSDASVHALIKAHCDKMCSRVGKSERQYIVGGASGETIDQTITRAKNLGDTEIGALVYPGFNDYTFDGTSKIVTWSPVYYAAKEIGRQVALAINEPATKKAVSHLGWSKDLTITELEKLIAAGVWCGQKDRSGNFVNARSVTVFQGSNITQNEFSSVREALFASRDLREAIERSIVGRAGVPDRFADIDAIVFGKLAFYAEDLKIFVGNPAYFNYKKRIVGDTVYIDYDANLTLPVNFVFITSHFSVFAEG